MAELIDTNVIVRYLVASPESIPARFAGVHPFFEKLERGEVKAQLPALVLFQAYFVLTSYYEVPGAEAAEKLTTLLSFKGLVIDEETVLRHCLRLLQDRKLDLVDAYLVARAQAQGHRGVYSYDDDLRSCGLELLPIE